MRKSDWWTVVRPHSREFDLGAYDRTTAKAQHRRNQVRTSPSPTQTPTALTFSPVVCPAGRVQVFPPQATPQSCMSRRIVSGSWRDGMVGDGMVGDGVVGDGIVGDGIVGDGIVGDGMVGDGIVGDGVEGRQDERRRDESRGRKGGREAGT